MNTEPFSQTGQLIELRSEHLPVQCICWYVLIMSRTRFSVNPHSIIAWMSRNSCSKQAKIWSLSNCSWTQTHNHLVNKQTPNHVAKLVKWFSFVVSTYLYGTFACMFFIMSCLRFRVNPHSIVAWNPKHFLQQTTDWSKKLNFIRKVPE